MVFLSFVRDPFKVIPAGRSQWGTAQTPGSTKRTVGPLVAALQPEPGGQVKPKRVPDRFTFSFHVRTRLCRVQHDPHLAEQAHFRARSADRTEATVPCTIVRVDGSECAGEVQNLSPGGALLASTEPVPVGTFLTLRFTDGEKVAAEVKWNDGPHCGCRFPRALTVRQYLRIRQGVEFEGTTPEKPRFIDKLRSLLPRKA
jgi:hypothetical protein